MFRIRRIYDDVVPANREAIRQVQEILATRFPAAPTTDRTGLGEKLRNPFKQRFRTVLFVADSTRLRVRAFAILLHEPELKFCFLDYIATGTLRAGGGVGAALYERVRAEARALGSRGLFFECLPDNADACPDPALRKENVARLRFYERFGARPIVNTLYELPVNPGDECTPHLVFDDLDRDEPLSRGFARRVVRAVLERKYGHICSPQYVDEVVESFRDEPVSLRPFRYIKPSQVRAVVSAPDESANGANGNAARARSSGVGELIALVVSDGHELHHVRERGYVESPVRIPSILAAIEPTGLFERVDPVVAPERRLLTVHDASMVGYLQDTCRKLEPDRLLYPYVFPIRNQARPPKDSSVRAGYYCIDTFTPLSRAAWMAARRAVDCTLTAAREILEGRRAAYALVRPPGHHAERSVFGGFCYFNNAAIAAEHLAVHGRVAMLDVDYHHGNGQQDIFWLRSDVLTVSIHGHPRFAYPYFSGFEDERGAGAGEGYNLNIPLPEQRNGDQYRHALHRALRRIATFDPAFLVVSLGLDTAKGDPTGTWSLGAKDFQKNGQLIGELGLSTLVVQEGGYRTRTLGSNARAFFQGLAAGQLLFSGRLRAPVQPLRGITFRVEPAPGDPERVRALVESTGMFHDFELPVAEELVRERLARGEESGYHFLLAERDGRLVGYTCFGPVACTMSSFDLFWIAVHPEMQGKGLGRRLLLDSEKRVRKMGGTRIYIETSHREAYAATRSFYLQCGYGIASVLDDFYAPGDAKAIYCKVL